MAELSAVIQVPTGRRLLRFTRSTRVQHVVQRLAGRLESDDQPFTILVSEGGGESGPLLAAGQETLRRRCSMLALCVVGRGGAVTWLHEQQLMGDVWPARDAEDRLELRLRVLACDAASLLQSDAVAFQFLYDQRRCGFLGVEQSAVSLDSALMLACYDIRRYFSDLPQKALDKKSNMDYLEQKVGIDKFLPVSWVDSSKPKVLRKLIQQQFKKIGHLNNIDSMLAYLQLLDAELPWQDELFLCRSLERSRLLLTVNYRRGVVLQEDGEERCERQRVELEQLSDVVTTAVPDGFLLTLNLLSGSPVSALFDSPEQCCTAASLIDAHHRLVTGSSDGVWHSQASIPRELLPRAPSSCELPSRVSDAAFDADYAEIVDMKRSSSVAEGRTCDANEEDGYSTVDEVSWEVQRDCVHIEEVLGEGQYGNVFFGSYVPPAGESSGNGGPGLPASVPVAVKTCKADLDSTQLESFLSEARNMYRLRHPYIVRLLGVCSECPVLILMEPAALGELRAYLRRHAQHVGTSTLVLFVYQLSQALAYLERRRFVHRDIAARNVLVYSPRCVKLADFGLGRWLDQDRVYRAARCKLPIKWMAPESINFRRFSCESDVWMFGVCVWEIMSLCAEKPFQGVINSEVADLIESGRRLARPLDCPPPLYGLMLNCWHYDPARRPRFLELCSQLQQMHETGSFLGVATVPETESDPEPLAEPEPVSTAPTACRNREGDAVYRHTTAVVSAVVQMSHALQHAPSAEYAALVRSVAAPLRHLLAAVDAELARFAAAAHARVQMAHKVLAKDMQDLVDAMRRAVQYDNTTLDAEYRKQMLSAAHVVAVDSKSLLDVVDSVREDAPQD